MLQKRYLPGRIKIRSRMQGPVREGFVSQEESLAPLPLPHSCWVCASREPGFVDGSKTRRRVDLEALEHVFSALRLINAVHSTGRGVVCAVMVVLAAHFTIANAEGVENGHVASVRSLGLAGMALASIAAVVLGKTVTMNDGQKAVMGAGRDAVKELSEEEKMKLAETLADALKIKTVSFDKNDAHGKETDPSELLELHELLKERFPLVHSNPNVKRAVINKYSLLFEWVGTDSSLEPLMLCAHLDVVPTPNASQWSVDEPFCGSIDEEGTIWGRGAIDNKHNVIGQLMALEKLLEEGKSQPARTIFIACGHDEEIGGWDGAKHISTEVRKRLDARGQNLCMLVDEGSFVVENVLPGVRKPIALISNVEKGSVSIKLTAKGACPPGHSSMPPAETNVGVLARAIRRLEENPFPAVGMDDFFDSFAKLGSELPFWARIVFSNPWLFKPLVGRVVLQKNQAAAGVRTTTAVTLGRFGSKVNVIPAEACAWVNHRIHPKDKDADHVLAYDEKIIRDSRVNLEAIPTSITPPSPFSPIDCEQYDIIRRSARDVFDAPSLNTIMIGNTDTRHYWTLFPEDKVHIYRFSPVLFENLKDLSMFHGIDERIHKEKLVQVFQFYYQLIEAVDKSTKI